MKKLVYLTIGFLIIEIAARLTGAINFPLYILNDKIGYIVSPGQNGSFLNKNNWIVNDKSQGAEKWSQEDKSVLLLGDSIVWGGNLFDHKDKLGAQLEDKLNYRVWPAASGGWGVANEVAYLDLYPEVVAAAETIVWLVDNGDLGELVKWRSEEKHPTKRPFSAVIYLLKKYISPFSIAKSTPQISASSEETKIDFARKVAELKRMKKKLIFVICPTKTEFTGNDTERNYSYKLLLKEIKNLIGDVELVELRESPEWSLGLYRDEIHPNKEGYSVLATILFNKIQVNGLNY